MNPKTEKSITKLGTHLKKQLEFLGDSNLRYKRSQVRFEKMTVKAQDLFNKAAENLGISSENKSAAALANDIIAATENENSTAAKDLKIIRHALIHIETYARHKGHKTNTLIKNAKPI